MNPAELRAFRADVLRECGATDAELDSLLAYTENAFTQTPADTPANFPLADEPFVSAWREYSALSDARGVLPTLRDRLVQLRFPVESGISELPAYQAATRRGDLAQAPESGVQLHAPDRLELRLHPTPAGTIPVLVAGERADFVALVRALTRRNEPAPIPDSMGACIVAGYNNWDRVARLRESWQVEHPNGSDAEWQLAFGALVPRKELYQDRFILLSRGPYSAVQADQLGLDAAEWEACSLQLRLEHECTHYFTRRVLGSMRNSLHDELVADFAGIVAACGRFRASWLLHFFGLEHFPGYRPGGRLQNYLGEPPLGDDAFRVLRSLVWRAANVLEALDHQGLLPMTTPAERAETVRALTRVPLEALAVPDAGDWLRPAQPDVLVPAS